MATFTAWMTAVFPRDCCTFVHRHAPICPVAEAIQEHSQGVPQVLWHSPFHLRRDGERPSCVAFMCEIGSVKLRREFHRGQRRESSEKERSCELYFSAWISHHYPLPTVQQYIRPKIGLISHLRTHAPQPSLMMRSFDHVRKQRTNILKKRNLVISQSIHFVINAGVHKASLNRFVFKKNVDLLGNCMRSFFIPPIYKARQLYVLCIH